MGGEGEGKAGRGGDINAALRGSGEGEVSWARLDLQRTAGIGPRDVGLRFWFGWLVPFGFCVWDRQAQAGTDWVCFFSLVKGCKDATVRYGRRSTSGRQRGKKHT